MKPAGWLRTRRAGQLRQFCAELFRPGKSAVVQAPGESLSNSPLFSALIAQLRPVERCRVLDLGPAIGANVSFFGELHCRLQIADCGMALLELPAPDAAAAADAYASALEQLLPIDALTPCDAILVWDLLNYLDKPLFRALMEHLSPVVSGDTWLHGYIGSRREMPALPQHYRLDAEGRVWVRPASAASRGGPCYSQSELRTLMPRFGVSRSTLLQNGLQEYLFRGEGRRHRLAVS